MSAPGQRLKYDHPSSYDDVDGLPRTESQPGRSTGSASARQEGTQKRPYRQRRKNPSCDACRGRKVKCDASDAGACSECLTRGVPCCFTKENNRRISSLKQIQDLERRLGKAKQEIIQLRTLMSRTRTDKDDSDLTRLIGQSSLTGPASSLEEDAFSTVTLTWHRSAVSIFVEELPPRAMTMLLLRLYDQFIYPRMPIVSLPDVQQEVDKLYEHGKLDNVPQAWRGMLLAILACTLQLARVSGKIEHDIDPDTYAEMAIVGLDQSWTGEMTLDHLRLALLFASYFFEANSQIASGIWHSTAFVLARQLRCYESENATTGPEEAAKQALTTAIRWSRLRYIALYKKWPTEALGLSHQPDNPIQMQDHFDIDISTLSRTGSLMYSVLQVIPKPVVDCTDEKLDDATLQSFEAGLARAIGTDPATLSPDSSVPLRPDDLFPAYAIQMVRMLVLTHSLDDTTLSMAIVAGENTARLVSRMKSNQSHRFAWTEEIRAHSTSMLCLHLWRCQLILTLGGRLEPAKLLIEISTMIGESQNINRKCSQSLAFFLDRLAECIDAGNDPQTDERLLSYVDAKLDDLVELATMAETGPRNRLNRQESSDSATSDAEDDIVPEDEWMAIQRRVILLEEMRRRSQRQPHSERASSSNPPSAGSTVAQSSRSRMQISNILE